MEDKEIIEGNRVIAEFMGLKWQSFNGRYNVFSVPEKEQLKYQAINIGGDKLPYNLSWDWLMPVAQKILQTPLIKGRVMEQTHNMEIVVNGLMIADMCKIYFACIDFITWYSQHKQPIK